MVTDVDNPASSAKGQSEIPVMWDASMAAGRTDFNHIPGGGNTLYMDGHVDFLRYPSKFPYQRSSMDEYHEPM